MSFGLKTLNEGATVLVFKCKLIVLLLMDRPSRSRPTTLIPPALKGTNVKLDDKERFDKEQIVVKEPFSVTNLTFTS